jgi:hypothetical protein
MFAPAWALGPQWITSPPFVMSVAGLSLRLRAVRLILILDGIAASDRTASRR